MVVRSYKFDSYPFSLDRCKKEEIEEGYIVDPFIMARKVNDECFYVTLLDDEMETKIGDIPYSFFIHNASDVVHKTRFIVPLWGETVCNLDFYHDSDLKVASVEFDEEEDSQGFYPPAWFGEEIKDVKELKRVS